ncbi:MAG TPA: hypothetical protein VKB69_01620, partial [Micromonosporaceae bacterium]|nr:hypothetical protein [Micromonosporaceae bacterium]
VGVNTGWQTRLSVIAPVAAVIAAVVTYGYDRYTTRAAGTTGQTPDDGVARGPDRGRRGWWVPAAVVLGVVLCALVARTVTERGYEGPVLTLLSTDPDGSGARVGLVVMTLVPVALAVVVGGVAARWWGRAALRVTAVALAAGTALGVQTILVHDHSRILTCIVAAGAAVGAVLLVGRSRGVPWDILGVLAAGVGAGTALIRSTHGTSVSALSYALIIAGVVMALVGSLPVVRSLPASARGLLVGLGAVLFMAAAPVAVRIGASVLFSDPQTLGPAYRHQFWILAMLPTALASVAAVLAWFVGTRRMRRMPESIGMTG